MNASNQGGRGRFGVALSATELCVAEEAGAVPTGRRIPLSLELRDGNGWPDLTNALAELARTSGGGTLTIALLPPLIEVRQLELPPLGEGELLTLLARNAGRYFVSARGAQIVGVIAGSGPGDAPAPVLAAAAPSRIIEAIYSAARESGWTIDGITAAEGAWTAAAITLWPAFSRRPAQLLVHETDRTTLIEIDRGQMANVRRFRPGDADADLIGNVISDAAAHGVSPLIASIGGANGRRALLHALATRGMHAEAAPTAWDSAADASDLLAAAFAAAADGPMLASEAVRASRQQRLRRATWGVAAVAAVLWLTAPMIALWGVHRDLRDVEAQRAALHPQVAATFIGRTSVEDAYRRLAAVVAAQRTAPHWAAVLSQLSERLPDDAYFTTFRTRSDTLIVDGMASRASLVFNAIEQVPDLADVRAPAPVSREAPEGSDPMERFTLEATLRDTTHRSPAPSRPATGPGGQ